MSDFKTGGVPAPDYDTDDINYVYKKSEFTEDVFVYGDVKIKGTNIVLDATENVEIIAGGKVTIDSAELIATTQNTTRIHARKTRVSGSNIDSDGGTDITLITPKGSIKVKRIKARDIDWAQQVFAGTAVAGALGGKGAL